MKLAITLATAAFCLLLAQSCLAARPSVRLVYPPDAPIGRSWNDAIPEDLLAKVTEEAKAYKRFVDADTSNMKFGKRPTAWFPNDAEPKTTIEFVIRHFLNKIANPADCSMGAEWWVQYIKVEGNVGWHVDKDESVASNEMYLLHPVMASILYLSDVGGATIISSQYSPNGNGYVPSEREMAFLSAPKINKYTTFQGDLLHGVIEKPADKGQMRLTLLINYWDRQPLPPNCVTLDHSKLKGVEVLSPAQIQALEQKFKVGGQAPTEHEEEKEAPLHVPSEIQPRTLKMPPSQKAKREAYKYEFSYSRQQDSMYLPVSHKDGASIFLHYTDGKPSPRSKYDPFLNTPQPISMVNKMTDLYVRHPELKRVHKMQAAAEKRAREKNLKDEL